MELRRNLFFVLTLGTGFSLVLLLNSCSVGGYPIKDEILIERFRNNEVQFKMLVQKFQEDTKLRMIGLDAASYAGQLQQGEKELLRLESAGLTRRAWDSYQDQLRRLSLVQIIKSDSSPAIELKVEEESLLNGDSTWGYWYGPVPASALLEASLSGYTLSGQTGRVGGTMVVRRISTDWYLFLFVE